MEAIRFPSRQAVVQVECLGVSSKCLMSVSRDVGPSEANLPPDVASVRGNQGLQPVHSSYVQDSAWSNVSPPALASTAFTGIGFRFVCHRQHVVLGSL